MEREDGARTRDPNLGKVLLYQLSHFRAQGDILGKFLAKRKRNLSKFMLAMKRSFC